MREAGIEPAALVAKLARIGTSLPVEPFAEPAPLIESFDFADLRPRAGALRHGRARRRSTPASSTSSISRRCGSGCPQGMAEADWAAIRPNLAPRRRGRRLVGDPARPCRAGGGGRRIAPSSPPAAEAAEAIDWAESPWPQLVARLKETSGRAGKALFQPLRRALTGRDSGPEMAALLPLIGRDEALARLRAAAA